ncbi:MAG: DUF4249 domain-containing protein [Flavobacteriales bacterium]
MKNIFLILISLLSLFACQPKEKEIKVDAFSEKLVINSTVIPNSIMLVSLTRSFSILSDGYTNSSEATINNDLMQKLLVSDAVVTVSYSNKTDTLFMVAPGMYASITTAQYSDVPYTLHAVDKEHNLEITATENMLSKVELDDASFVYEDKVLKFKYKFTDPSANNYYMINVYHKSSAAVDPNNVDISTFLSSGNQYANSTIFSDINFNGKTTFGTLDMSEYIPQYAQDTMIVSLSNISEGYYRYLSLRQKAGNNILTQIMSEPINYPTNVQGGLGYFSTHFPDAEVLILPLKPE